MKNYLEGIKKNAIPAVEDVKFEGDYILFYFKSVRNIMDEDEENTLLRGAVGHNQDTGRIYIRIPNMIKVDISDDNNMLFTDMMMAQSMYEIDFGRFLLDTENQSCHIEGQFKDSLPLTGEILAWGMNCCIRLVLEFEFILNVRRLHILSRSGLLKKKEFDNKIKELRGVIDMLVGVTGKSGSTGSGGI